MRYIIDAQLPPSLARMIVSLGGEAKHVLELDMLEASDSVIWDLALSEGYVIITKDEDFAKRLKQSKVAPPIVWLRVGNVGRKALLDWFKPLYSQIENQLKNGENLIEVRR